MMKTYTVAAIALSCGLFARPSFANVSDTLCNVQMKNQVVQLDIGVEAETNTLSSVTFTGTDGKEHSLLKAGSLFSTVYFQYDEVGLNIQLNDKDGHNVFNLQAISSDDGSVGWLNGKIFGLDVKKGRVDCSNK